MPQTAWIWDISQLQLKAVLTHVNQIKSMEFSSQSEHLVITTGQNKAFIWNPSGASVCEIPVNEAKASKGLITQKAQWNNQGNALVLADKTNCVVAFPSNQFLASAGGGL
jgi:predicted oxidoreductase (fatty acid repression mutant protein)